MNRSLSPIDELLCSFDNALRTIAGNPTSSRPNPADQLTDNDLSDAERRRSAALMRVNHAGEIAAQALYQGQALTAQLDDVRDTMQQSAQEENDHLAWCKSRVHELHEHTSRLAPFWYAGSFAIGALAGIAGDRWSLGFVAETEKQVVEHLGRHLDQLPEKDARSRAIVRQMKQDEAKHGHAAITAGAAELPEPVRKFMRLTSKLMTGTAYWV